MKRILYISIMLIFSVLSVKAETWTDENGTVWSFSTQGTNATIEQGISGNIPNDLVIPSTVYVEETPYTITAIGEDAFNSCSNIKSVIIPEGVTEIGCYAFSFCYYLSYVSIPNGVTSIGNNAFNSCPLSSINIPDGVTEIGDYAFCGCTSLTSVCIPNGITSIEPATFWACQSLISVSIPESVTSIGENAFYNCFRLNSINISENVEYIGTGAFSACAGIALYSIMNSTLFGNSSLCVDNNQAVILVPDEMVNAYKTAYPDFSNRIIGSSQNVWKEYTLTAQDNESDLAIKVGENNLQNVTKLKVSGTINSYDMMVIRNKMINLLELDLKDVTIVANNYEYAPNHHSEDNVIGQDFLIERNIMSVVLPTSITRIGQGAFARCPFLQSVTNLSNNLTEIGPSAFDGCFSLTTIELPSSLISVEQNAFADCVLLSSINLPPNLAFLGDGAFRGCSRLTSIDIPDGMTVIPSAVFMGCNALENIFLPLQTTEIGWGAFSECSSLKSTHLPPYLTTIGDGAFGGVPLESIYAYMPDVPAIDVNSFATYRTANLYVPNFLFKNYFYDTNWSQFLSVNRCDLNPGDYEKLRTQSDVTIEDNDDIIPEIEPGNPIDGEVVGGGSITVGSDDPQLFDEMEQEVGDDQSGSLIADGGDGDSNNNMPTNTLKVKINVSARKWYLFCFPFNVQTNDIEFPGQFVWYEYNSGHRSSGMSGWEELTGTTLTAHKGYAFCAATSGTLIVKFNNPTFGGNRPIMLQEHTSANAANASWNFVGNPYSSYYDFQETDFDAPITVWNGTSYEAYRPGDDDYHLKPYQAFFVQKPTATDQINFEKDRRETYNQSRERRNQQANARRAAGIKPDRLLINLTIGDDETETLDRTRLVLNEKASLAYEIGCDAAKFIQSDAPAQLYMLEGNQKMAIDERPAAGDIRLGYMADKVGTLRISAPRMDLPMMLYDATTGLTYDLSLGSYEFQTEAGTFDKRFSLRFSDEATGIRNMTAKTGVAIGIQDGGLSIGGADGKDIDIYSTNGAQMARQTGNGFVSLPGGVYIVKVNGQSAKIHVK